MIPISSVNYALLDEMHRLVASSLAGSISREEMGRLEELLGQDVEARSLYLDVVHESCILLTWATRGGLETDVVPQIVADRDEGNGRSLSPAPIVKSPVPTSFFNVLHGSVSYFSSGWPLAYLIATVIFGIGILIGAFTHVSQPEQIAATHSAPVVPLNEPSVASVGQITGMADCQWARGIVPLLANDTVPVGREIKLESGLMEITYDSGAKVILQGPVTYEVESGKGGYLSLGKLTARVEKKTKKSDPQSLIPKPLFAVRTPTATVTDLGTEFGVEVGDSGATSTHVFRGVVMMQAATHNGWRGQSVRLCENESARVEKGNRGSEMVVRHVAIDPATFVRAEQLPKLAGEQRLKAFRRWQSYSQQLRRDPSLLAYYDFQQKPGSPAVLPNVADNGRGAFDGVVENATWTNGRMSGKHALLFNGPTDYVRLNLPQKSGSLTLAAWVCFDTLKDCGPAATLLGSENWHKPGQIHWMVDSGDRHVVLGCPIGGNAVGPVVVDDRQFRRWMHLACVYDHATARAWFYVGGRRVSGVDFRPSDPICIGPAWIGNWNQERRNFRGSMDELVIFGRPLAAAEVQRMYEEGKP
jgi:hypothetical protein